MRYDLIMVFQLGVWSGPTPQPLTSIHASIQNTNADPAFLAPDPVRAAQRPTK